MSVFYILIPKRERKKETERSVFREKERERETDRQTDRWTDRQIETERSWCKKIVTGKVYFFFVH